MFAAIGRFAVRFRWVIVAAWAAAAAFGVLVMPATSKFSMSTGFLAPGVQSVDAQTLIDREFPNRADSASTAILILEDKRGLSSADQAYAKHVIADVGSYDPGGNVAGATSVFDHPELATTLLSRDGTTLLIPVGIKQDMFSGDTANTIQALRAHLPAAPAGSRILVSGDAALGGDHGQACLDAVAGTAIVTLALIALILLFVYRSPIAPFVPLATIGVSAAVSLGIFGLLMDAGVTLSSFLQQFLIVVVFGAGTDYCLFMLSRYREELRRGYTREAAVERVMGRVGPVIASSAAIVAVGFASFAFAQFEMFRTIGPGLALSVVITLAAGLTLVPAMLALIPAWLLFWPAGIARVPVTVGTDSGRATGLWDRLGRLVAISPARVLVAGLVLLLIPALYLPSLRQTFEVDRELPPSYDSVAGLQILSSRFDASDFMPIEVVVQRSSSWANADGLATLTALDDRLADAKGVKTVRSAVRPLGQPIPAEMALASPQALAEYVSADGETALILIGTTTDTYSNATYDTVREIRSTLDAWSRSAGPGTTALVGGASAQSVDLLNTMNNDTPRLVILASLGVLIVTALLLRSIVAPIYLLAGVYLTIGTTLAATAFVFQKVLNFRVTGVDSFVPIFLFVLLLVLASDYSIFLMSRVKEEAEGHGLADGIRHGVAHTGGVISSAGLILAGTFGALVITPLASLVEMGFAIAIGVVIDTFIVRPLVIPALTRLLGRWAWWPGPLSRLPIEEPPAPVADRALAS